MVGQIARLDTAEELPELAHQLRTASAVALEFMAREHGRSPAFEAHRVAAVQLRMVRDLAGKMGWLADCCTDLRLEPELRVALSGVLLNLTQDTELALEHDSRAAALLEVALMFHALFDSLRPWLPPLIQGELSASEPGLEMLTLGFSDYLHPLLRRRFETLWGIFHRLRRTADARLAVVADTGKIDEQRLRGLVAEPLTGKDIPVPPSWSKPNLSSTWRLTSDLVAAGASDRRL